MSGGQILPLLEDILYPNEKECFCTKYRIGFVRIGEALKGMHPKSKATILNAIRQSGFTKEDLRELDWTFSTHLWNVGNFSLPGIVGFGKAKDATWYLSGRPALPGRRASSSGLEVAPP